MSFENVKTQISKDFFWYFGLFLIWFQWSMIDDYLIFWPSALVCPVKSLFRSGMWFWIGYSIRHLYILDMTDSWSTHKGLAFFVCKPRKKCISSNSGQITMIDGVTNCFDRFDLKRLPFYTLYNNHNLINKAYLILSHFPSSQGLFPNA